MNSKASGMINYFIAFMAGAVISAMVVCNTELGVKTSNNISIAVNQLVGIITLSVVMMITAKNKTINPPRQKAPLWRWFGGLFGLLILTINYFAVLKAGTTIAMAACVLGQCMMGVIFDLTGALGMEKRKVTRKKTISLIVSFAGILVMMIAPSDASVITLIIYALLSMVAGALTMTQMVYNSGFAKLKGPLFSARQNVISGLGGILLFILIFNFGPSAEAVKGMADLTLLQIVSGGMLGCVVVVSSNIVIPKIPGAASSILISAGQILSAVILDYFIYSTLNPVLIVGAGLMILGTMLSD